MKKIFLILVMIVATLTASAIRPISVAFPHHQSDGTTISAYLHGNGFEAFYTSVDGVILMRDAATNNLCYATVTDGKLAASSLLAHEADQRSAEETAFVQKMQQQVKETAIKELAAKNEAVRKVRGIPSAAPLKVNGMGTYGQNSFNGTFPSVGRYTIPVIMVEFSDRKFMESTTQELVSNMFNQDDYNGDTGADGSARQYFVDQSGGLFIPTFDVVAKVSLNHPYSYYGTNTPSQDNNVRQLITDAVTAAANQGIDFKNYYYNGSMPLVSIYYAGPGEATGGDANTVWPHFSTLYGKTDGYNINSYFVGNEIFGDSTYTEHMGIGVFVHEFGHALGLPDFYCTDYSYENNAGFGMYDVMDQGAYYGLYARMPVGYTAYEKSFMGWLQIPELTEPQHVTLQSPLGTAEGSAVYLSRANSNNEYFILENRQTGKWYPSLLGTGLMLTRYAYNFYSWTYYNDVNNNQNAKRAMIVTADGSTITDGKFMPSILFGNGYASIDSLTLFNSTKKQYAGITSIQKHNDGTCTFNFLTSELRSIPKEGNTYVKVTSMDDLASGDTVLIVNEDRSMALSSQTGRNHLIGKDVYIENDTVWAGYDATPLLLSHTADHVHWMLCPANRQYITVATAAGTLTTSNQLSYNAAATISITDGNATIQFIGSNKHNTIGFNADELSFAGYTASTAPAIQLFKRQNLTSGISTITFTRDDDNDAYYNLAGQRVSPTTKGLLIHRGKKVINK